MAGKRPIADLLVALDTVDELKASSRLQGDAIAALQRELEVMNKRLAALEQSA